MPNGETLAKMGRKAAPTTCLGALRVGEMAPGMAVPPLVAQEPEVLRFVQQLGTEVELVRKAVEALVLRLEPVAVEYKGPDPRPSEGAGTPVGQSLADAVATLQMLRELLTAARDALQV